VAATGNVNAVPVFRNLLMAKTICLKPAARSTHNAKRREGQPLCKE